MNIPSGFYNITQALEEYNTTWEDWLHTDDNEEFVSCACFQSEESLFCIPEDGIIWAHEDIYTAIMLDLNVEFKLKFLRSFK